MVVSEFTLAAFFRAVLPLTQLASIFATSTTALFMSFSVTTAQSLICEHFHSFPAWHSCTSAVALYPEAINIQHNRLCTACHRPINPFQIVHIHTNHSFHTRLHSTRNRTLRRDGLSTHSTSTQPNRLPPRSPLHHSHARLPASTARVTGRAGGVVLLSHQPAADGGRRAVQQHVRLVVFD